VQSIFEICPGWILQPGFSFVSADVLTLLFDLFSIRSPSCFQETNLARKSDVKHSLPGIAGDAIFRIRQD